MDRKILTLDDALSAVLNLRKAGVKVVFTNGCFDILHAGHAAYLEQAKELGDMLVVGLNSDLSVRLLKGEKRPLVPQAERAAVLAALEVVDMVVLFDEATPVKLIEALQPEIDVKGGDYRKEDLPEYPLVESYGGRVEILPFKDGCSTSGLIDKIVRLYGH